MSALPLAAGGVALVAAAVFAYVGAHVARRPVSEENRVAGAAFAVWWFSLAGYYTLRGATVLLIASGYAHLPTFETMRYLNVLILCTACWAITYHVVFLFTGRRGWIVPISVTYALVYAVGLYVTARSRAVGVAISGWRVEIAQVAPLEGTARIAILLALLGPPLLGSLAYMSLTVRLKDATQRYRSALISWSILVWLAGSLVGSLANLTWLQAVSHFVLGFVAALAVLMAYKPPRWAQARFGVAPSPRE
ncbi:MAG TPA: hypothetical protein VM582_06605 [Candidatus Thermoplasmatota archaeon]|nr:hypothetical protein [Candidatus Thermoplasmatota archaeon]